MTESELISAILENGSVENEVFAIYFSLLFAYLFAAHLAGKTFSRKQLIILNGIYSVVMLFFMNSTLASGVVQFQLISQLVKLDSFFVESSHFPAWAVMVPSVIQLGCFVVSLYYMKICRSESN
jgi:hypothetical protein